MFLEFLESFESFSCLNTLTLVLGLFFWLLLFLYYVALSAFIFIFLIYLGTIDTVYWLWGVPTNLLTGWTIFEGLNLMSLRLDVVISSYPKPLFLIEGFSSVITIFSDILFEKEKPSPFFLLYYISYLYFLNSAISTFESNSFLVFLELVFDTIDFLISLFLECFYFC